MIKIIRLAFFAASLLCISKVRAQNFEFGYGIGLNWATLNVVDSTAGVPDPVRNYTYEIKSVGAPGYTFMAYGLYHLNENWDIRLTTGADWLNGKISVGRPDLFDINTVEEELFFEGWFHFAPGLQYSYEILPGLFGVSAGVDMSFSLAAINIITDLPSSDTVSFNRDFYEYTGVHTTQNGFNVFVRPHVQFNFIRKSGRKWVVNFQYEQGILPYFESRSLDFNYIDTFEPGQPTILESGYFVSSRASRFTVTLGAELPWGTPNRKKPRYNWFNL